MLRKKISTSRLLNYAASCFIVLGLFSCKREILKRELLSDYEANSYGEAFNVFWNGLNSNYLFWDQETVNWDSMYRAYKPKFDSLDKVPYSDTSLNACFQYMADMTQSLKDGQYALLFWPGGDFNFEGQQYKSYISFIPKLIRAQRVRQALPDTLFDYIIQNNYLKNFDYGVYFNPDTRAPFQIITGRLKKGTKNVLYSSLNSFAIKESFDYQYGSRPTRPVIKNFFDNIHKSNCDAVIVDLRNNRGGNQEDINYLVGQFSTRPFLFGYARYKSGSGRLDYTPPIAMNVTSQEGSTDFSKQIVILTDQFSSALCESVILAFKALPDAKVTVIGEPTYGTSGFLTGNDISTNGGSFNISSFSSVRISNAGMMDKNRKFNFAGIQPDIEVKYTNASISQMLSTGIDIQLEKAIQFINQ